MALDKINMSLEEIIKLEKPRRGFAGPRFKSGRGVQTRRNISVYDGGVHQFRRNVRTLPRAKILPDIWKHDLYQEERNVGVISYSNNRSPIGTLSRSPAILHISNLDFGVSDTDIKELFGEFGTLLKAAIHYDRSGRSMGNAEVEFENNADALKAIKQYNNVPLDGKPMKIVLLNENGYTSQMAGGRGLQGRVGPKNDYKYNVPPARQQFLSSQNFPRQSNNTQIRRYGLGGDGAGGGRRNNKSIPSKEDLDAELDNYSSKMEH